MGVLVRIAMSMRVHVPVGRSVVVAVGVSVVQAALPSEEEPGGKKHYYAPDRHLGYPLDDLRQIAAQKHERQAHEDEGCAMAEAPEEAHQACFPGSSEPSLRGDQGGDRGQVVGVRGVPQAHQEADQQHDLQARARALQNALEPAVYRGHAGSILWTRTATERITNDVAEASFLRQGRVQWP